VVGGLETGDESGGQCWDGYVWEGVGVWREDGRGGGGAGGCGVRGWVGEGDFGGLWA